MQYFNYVSIYIRFALSLLVGTRTFLDSANIEHVSYHLKVMRIIEKSNTKISGIRIIPLCNTALKLIQKYKQITKDRGLNNHNFYLYFDNDYHIFNVNNIRLIKNLDDMIVNFVENVPLNFGRHLFSKHAIERDLPQDYIDAFLGHYMAGLEQFGIYSTINFKEYVRQITEITEMCAKKYKIKEI